MIPSAITPFFESKVSNMPSSTVDPQDNGPAIIGVTWAFTIFAMIVVALRFYARIKFANGLKAHDWVMLVATVYTAFRESFGYIRNITNNYQQMFQIAS